MTTHTPTEMDFPLEEYRERLLKTQAEMQRIGLPVMVLHQPENILYLTGFYTTGYFSYHAIVVPAEGDPVLLLRDVELPAARSSSWVGQHFIYKDEPDPVPAWMDTTRRALEELGLAGGKVGLDEHSWFLTIERWKKLQSLLPNAELVQEPRIVDHIRLIKSSREIALLRVAARQAELGVVAGVAASQAGETERTVATAVFNELLKSGSGLPLSGIIISGTRTDQLHGDFSDRRLEKGDTVYFELQGIHQKYWARIMRTTTVGPATDEQKKAAETIIRIQDEAIALMQPGENAGRVDRAFREPLVASGLKKDYTNRTGYSLGLNYRPSAGEFIREFVPGVDWTLEPGMVFHMLMMGAGMGFSETVLITESGPERLTTMERKLFERN